MSDLIKRLSGFSDTFGIPNDINCTRNSKNLEQLKNSLDVEHNLKTYYNNIVGYMNTNY